MATKVIAISPGVYLGKFRRAGEIFLLEDGDKRGKWMELADVEARRSEMAGKDKRHPGAGPGTKVKDLSPKAPVEKEGKAGEGGRASDKPLF